MRYINTFFTGVISSSLGDTGALLGPQFTRDSGRKTLVLDLDETLVHSSFKEVPNASFIIPVEIDNYVHNIYVCKRPGVDEFLNAVAAHYELVIFTASLSTYADPLMNLLDPKKLCSYRLFREHCTLYNNSYVKDLSRLGRSLEHVIIIDVSPLDQSQDLQVFFSQNSPVAYSFQPDNAIPIRSWFDDEKDRELYDLVPILQALSLVDDIPEVLRATLGGEDEEEEEEENIKAQPVAYDNGASNSKTGYYEDKQERKQYIHATVPPASPSKPSMISRK